MNQINNNKDVLVLSPTGSGKTIAGFLPSIIDIENIKKNSLHTLYISPLKSLGYDIERNLLQPINELNLNISISVRTGDTSSYLKKKQSKYPPNFLITTPESFALLMSYVNAKEYFNTLKFIIIDELHNIIHTKRGDLLSLNLSRLNGFNSNIKKIALSATIKDSNISLQYFTNNNAVKVENSEKKKFKVSILSTKSKIPWFGYMPLYAIKEIYLLIKSHKSSIIFVNTRAQSEYVFQSLWKINKKKLKISVHHGSLERDIRKNIEEQMFRGNLNCVIATSSLELGIDWGDIDLVIQIGAPKGVSRIIQRIGRSNHNIKSPSKAILVPTNKFEYLECYAAIQAIKNFDIEDAPQKKGSLDVLAQHICGVACSEEFKAKILYNEIIKAYPYKNLKIKTFYEILNFIKNGGYSLEAYKEFSRIKKNSSGYYKITNERFVKKYRMNIGTIVESNQIDIFFKNKKLGKIEEYFIQNLSKGDTFYFASEVLEYIGTNLKGVIVKKSSSKNAKIPSYVGGKLPLSTKLANRVINLINTYNNEKLPLQIMIWLREQQRVSVLPPRNGLLVETFMRKKYSLKKHYIVLYTFQGRKLNQTLGIILLNRLHSFSCKPVGFVATDYAIAIWSLNNCNDIYKLLDIKKIDHNINSWLETTSLTKKHFKTIAVIAGLIDKNYPGYIKTSKQIKFNSDLIYEVLNKYEKNHILLKTTKHEILNELVEYDRLYSYFASIQNKIIYKSLNYASPLSIPFILEFNIERLKDEYTINDLEDEKDVLKEAKLL